MSNEQFNRDLLEFLSRSRTPFHAVRELSSRLEANGFRSISERESWDLQPGGRYYLTRNGSSIIAFVLGKQSPVDAGIRMVGAHTDSPCLKVKPNPAKKTQGYYRLGVEVYGGALLNPWFDRDLSIAGKVVYRDAGGDLKQTLVDFEKPVAVIPSLAIHLDREANQNRSINPQTDILPVLFQCSEGQEEDFRKLLQAHFEQVAGEVLEYDLYFYDTMPASIIGLNEEFIASARLDNLLSCFVGLQSLIEAGDGVTSMLVCNDHEEVGSTSAAGAQGPMLEHCLQRMIPDHQARAMAVAKSLMVSTDNAHGIHPNYADKHDDNHGPILNKGPVLKVNANQRYATTSESAGRFQQIAKSAGVETQVFVNRTDMGCGSTIGPLTSARIGVPTLDVGVPTFAMHSIRELSGVEDAFALYRILKTLFDFTGALTID